MNGQGYAITGNKALSAAATQTLLQYQPAAARAVKVLGWWVSLDSSAAGAGVRAQLVRQTTAGTGAATPPTPQDFHPDYVAAQGTVTWNHSAEPTLGAVLESLYLPPNGGSLYVMYPFGDEWHVPGGGDRLGIRVITPSAVSPNCDYGMRIREV